MADKVLFFTAGATPTAGEQAIIDGLAPRTEPQFQLEVRNVKAADYTAYAADGKVMPDYVLSDEATIPDAYSGVDVLDPEAVPAYPPAED